MSLTLSGSLRACRPDAELCPASFRLWRPTSQDTDPRGKPQLVLVTPCTLALLSADNSRRRQSTASEYALTATLTPSPVASLTAIQDAAFTLPSSLSLLVKRAGDAPLKLVGVLLGAISPLFEATLSPELSLDVPADNGTPCRLYQIPLPSTLLQGVCKPTSLTLVLTTDHSKATQQACKHAHQLHKLGTSARHDDTIDHLSLMDITDPHIYETASILLLPEALAADVHSIWQHKAHQVAAVAARFETEDDTLLMFSSASSSFESAHSSPLASPRVGSSIKGSHQPHNTQLSTNCPGSFKRLADTASHNLTDLHVQAQLWRDEFSTFNSRFATILHAKQTLLSATIEPEQAAALALQCFPVVDDVMGQLLACQTEGVALHHLPALVHRITQLLHVTVRQPLLHVCSNSATDGPVATPKLLLMGNKATARRRSSAGYYTPPASPTRSKPALHGWPTPSYPTPFSASSTTPFPPTTTTTNPAAALLESSLFSTPPPPPPATRSAPNPSPADLLRASSITHTSSTVLSLPADLVEPVQFSGHGLADQVNTAPSVQQHRWELMTSGHASVSPSRSGPPASPITCHTFSNSDSLLTMANTAVREANSPWFDTLLPTQRRI